jgi:hypothetical protein
MNQWDQVSFHQTLDQEEVLFKPSRPPILVDDDIVVIGPQKPKVINKHFVIKERKISYDVRLHVHPYVPQLVRRLLRGEVRDLQAADTEYVRNADGTIAKLPDGKNKPVLFADIFSKTSYDPTAFVKLRPVRDLDFTTGGAYAVYNWELFFHVPFSIAVQLSKNGRYAEAQKWFHLVFDPTDDSEGPTPERFWKVRPFQYTDVRKIEEIIANLSTNVDPELRNETIRAIENWREKPFQPHVIARFRQQAYMYKTVMAYLDNLIAWGDSLFREDSPEAVDEALMIYVLAANILGPRPQAVPDKGKVRPQTYANLRGDLSRFGDAMRDLEAELPFDLMPFPDSVKDKPGENAVLRSMGRVLYFCVPRNDKLLGYWDTVADRLFKIHNSLNIQGVFRQLPLFAPPIDPAMLVRAAAAGLDIGAVVSGINQPLPLVRFSMLVQKAAEICQEVKSLGQSLLAAMEKHDGEAMQVLRARHERVVLELAEQVRYAQAQEAVKSREGLLASLAGAVARYAYYERQLGRKANEIAIPQMTDLDKAALEKLKLSAAEPSMPMRDLEVDIAASLEESGGEIVSSREQQEIAKLNEARGLNESASEKDRIGAGLSLLPELGVDFAFWGIGGHLSFGGSALSRAMSFWASFGRADADKRTYEAGNASRIGSYARREQDWMFQSNMAAHEINGIFKQLRAAQIREAIAERELSNHRKQIENAKEIEHFLNANGTEKSEALGKPTNQSLYAWMKREVRGLYTQAFQFAFDVARKAERALQHELGNHDLTFLQFGYLAGKEGLLAGEKLYLDIKRMEMAHLDLNQREYELTRHVSLQQLDPRALLQLRRTGSCRIFIPEEMFDLDGPGHHFRRIKSVAVSIPCVTGPYTSINCTLTLLKSSIRKSPTLADGVYERQGAEDPRFADYFGSMQSIVASSAQNDSGMFEPNLHDERYLPFEGSGAISEWRLTLPADPSKNDPRLFDYETVTDVILHIRYTAREGGSLLRNTAVARLKTMIDEAQAAGMVRLFSVRHEFPTEWARFQKQNFGANERFKLSLNLLDSHYPFWTQGRLANVTRLTVFARGAQPTLDVFVNGNRNDNAADKDTLTRDAALGSLLRGEVTHFAPAAHPTGPLDLFFNDRAVDDVWIALGWSA